MSNIIRKFIPKSFRMQLILGLGLILSFIIIIFIYLETKKHADFLRSESLAHASDRSLAVATMSKVWVMTNDYVGLEEVLDSFSVYGDFVFIAIIDMDGKIIAHTDHERVGEYIADKERVLFLKRALKSEKVHTQYDIKIFQNSHYIDIIRTIQHNEHHIGLVNLRIDQTKIKKNIENTIYYGAVFTGLYLMIAIMIAYLTANRVTSQLFNLIMTMKEVRNGNKNVKADEGGVSELSQLSHEFNSMLDTLFSSEESFRAIFDQSPFGVAVIDSYSGHIYKVNEMFASIVGRTKEEMAEVDWLSITHPDDIQEDLDNMARLNAGKITGFSMYKRYIHPDGSVVWINMTIAPLKEKDGRHERHLCMIEDITERKKSEESLRLSEKSLKEVKERLEYAVNGTRDGLWDWNLETDEVYFSPHWKEILGYEEDELPNVLETWKKLVYPDDLEKVEQDIALSQESPGQFYENIHRLIHKDGHLVWILDRGQTLFNEEGKAVRMVGFHTDISKQKQLEQELLEQEELVIAQSRHVAMGEMIGMIAHQWRQPLTIIAMGANNVLADIALEDVSVEHFKQEAEDILKQTEYLSKTIDDFRNFFRPNKEKDEVKVQDILLEAKQIIGKSLEYHNIELTIADDDTQAIHTYSRELLQVFLNLLKNAKEALEEKNPDEGYIHVRVESAGDSVVIRICDNGGGIDPAIISRIFDPYFSTKDKKTGTGLGLYMSKTIVEKHLHGTITATNTDSGVCFTITISKLKDRNV
ncbi:MAG: PAS domain S-box protein [Sulfuricurvum sp.]|jgi:PAS domain S-box-containing protein